MHRFFLLVLSRDFPGGRAYSILPRIGRTYPGPPPEVEGLVKTKLIEEISRLKDDSAYIEQLIRENYGYVRQDEAFYQIGGQELKGNR
jgi:hypothetical protein